MITGLLLALMVNLSIPVNAQIKQESVGKALEVMDEKEFEEMIKMY